MGSPTTVLAIFAHPDDAEFLGAGTLIHLLACGAKIHLVTMTAGDCGSSTLSPAKISATRRAEAARAARLVRGTYQCLEEKDLSIFYDRQTLMKVMEVLRRARPSLVLTHSPIDYMVDHETTSRLVQSACFGSTAANFQKGRMERAGRSGAARGAAKPLAAIPHLYYAQAFGGRDILSKEMRPNLFVDITGTLERKIEMLACHKSQQAWLKLQQGMLDYRGVVQEMAARAGRLSGLGWAEGFNQHLGQGFPQDNLLGSLLGDLVRDARG